MKNFRFNFALLLFAAATMITVSSCNSDEEEEIEYDETEVVTVVESLDYADYPQGWGNYMQNVAQLLYNDSHLLYTSWSESYEDTGKSFAEIFKSHSGSGYNNVNECVDEIVDKMAEIANEVGEAKIGEPFYTWRQGDHVSAVLAVESWYSWHSRDDYTNNIYSIRNAYFGKFFGENESASVQQNSLASLIQQSNPTLHTKVVNAINLAANSIQSIHNPFRNYINTIETYNAIEACAALQTVLDKELKPAAKLLSEESLDLMIANYVDNVVVPTYRELDVKNTQLLAKVNAFAAAPSNQGFELLAAAWMESRRPWETSEAFLFGPVDALQLDPNMDSWPLDQEGIENSLRSGNYDNEWSESDSDEAIEAAQALRGFHTLEYLIFKDGKPRKTSK
ncbi:MAG: peptidase M75 [Bacteroidaceae bacterium]|nr:peptidase M75 [Bacteroidaceae bacterium]